MPDVTVTHNSLMDLAKAAKEYANPAGWSEDWTGVDTWEEAEHLAVHGMEGSAEVLAIAESAIETIEKEHDVTQFTHVWDVSGCQVDIGRYLSGEPDCMVDYLPAPTPKVGRVIALCASVCYSAAIYQDTINKRGQGIAALAFALNRLGFAVELWADFSISNKRGGSRIGRVRTLVKGANDELDPARIMFAYTHPAMSRALSFAACGALPYSVVGDSAMKRGNGTVTDAKQDLPEGTLYLPSLRSSSDVPEAPKLLLKYLRELGIVTD